MDCVITHVGNLTPLDGKSYHSRRGRSASLVLCIGGRSSSGRAPDCDSGGGGFKTRRPPHSFLLQSAYSAFVIAPERLIIARSASPQTQRGYRY